MQTSQNSIRVAGGAWKKHKSKCLLLHLSSLQQHDAGLGMRQVDAAAALEKCQICCCVLLHLRLTAYSVAMLLPFAFCLAASTDWLQASALELAYKHYKLFTFSPATRSKQPWPGSCSRFNWVFVRQGVGGCFFPKMLIRPICFAKCTDTRSSKWLMWAIWAIYNAAMICPHTQGMASALHS